MTKKTHEKINWAAPSEEDIAYLRSLSREEHKQLLRDMLDAASQSGTSSYSMEDIWREALRRASRKEPAE